MRFPTLSAFALASGIIAALIPFAADAQIPGMDVESLSIIISPQYPRPHDLISITPNSTLIDLSASTIVLYVNGKKIGESTGTGGFTVAAPGPGETMSLRLVATYRGEPSTATATIRPAEVSLVAEPTSTTHLLYRGAPLLPSEGRARIVAVPDVRTSPGARISAATLSYSWKLGDTILTDQSGIGHSVLVMNGPVRYRDATIILTVTDQSGTMAAQSSLILSPADPVVRVYRNDPLLGPEYHRAIGTAYGLTGEEESFIAVPYFFVPKPSLTWSVNGNASGTDDVLTVRTNGAGAGQASVSVLAAGESALSSGAFSTIVSFGQSGASSGFFGL